MATDQLIKTQKKYNNQVRSNVLTQNPMAAPKSPVCHTGLDGEVCHAGEVQPDAKNAL